MAMIPKGIGMNFGRREISARKRRRAVILVLTLWIVVVLGMISSSMVEEVYLEMKVAKLQRDDLEAMALARAALARAVADLRNDLIMDRQSQEPWFDALGDVWARMDKTRLDVPMGRGTWSVWVDDECAKFNLNTVSFTVLKTIFYEEGLKEKEAQALAGAIIDWRDPDDRPMPPGTGKEDEYYSAVVAKATGQRWDPDEEPIYRCKNDRFTSVEELLLVAGMTPELFYGFDPEKEIPPNPIERLKARAKETRRRKRDKEAPPLCEIFTVQSPGAVNLNTADRFVLRVLFRSAIGDPQVADSMAEKVIQLRKTDARGNSSNEIALRKVNDLVGTAGLPAYILPRLTALSPLTVRSDVFRIWALGEVGNSQHLICAVVARGFDRCQPERLTPLFENGIINERLADRFHRRHGDDMEPIEQAAVRVVQWFEL